MPPPPAPHPRRILLSSPTISTGTQQNAAEDKKDHAAIAAAAGRIGADNPESSTAPHAELHAGDTARSKAPERHATPSLCSILRRGLAVASPPRRRRRSSPEAAAAAVPLAGLAVEIAARAQAGRNRFEIRLDPPELGRIDVRLDVDRSGHVTSRLMVDRAETLDALRRDAGDLERALQQAGFKTADNGMQFTLRDQSFAGRDQSFPATASWRGSSCPLPISPPSDTMPAGYGRLLRPAAASTSACEEPLMGITDIIPGITSAVTAAITPATTTPATTTTGTTARSSSPAGASTSRRSPAISTPS